MESQTLKVSEDPPSAGHGHSTGKALSLDRASLERIPSSALAPRLTHLLSHVGEDRILWSLSDL